MDERYDEMRWQLGWHMWWGRSRGQLSTGQWGPCVEDNTADTTTQH